MAEIVICTSLMRSRLERQKRCVESWQKIGQVFSFGAEEINRDLEKEFPGVEFFFLGNNQRGLKRHLARIDTFFNYFSGRDRWVILTNSDIDFRGEREFLEGFLQPGCLTYFRRKNYEKGSEDAPGGGPSSMFAWGIDTFIFNGLEMADLPPLQLSIGMPFWDYWIPWEALGRGLRLQSSLDAPLYHENHGDRWDEVDWFRAAKIFFETYAPAIPPWRFGLESLNIHRQIIESTMMS